VAAAFVAVLEAGLVAAQVGAVMIDFAVYSAGYPGLHVFVELAVTFAVIVEQVAHFERLTMPAQASYRYMSCDYYFDSCFYYFDSHFSKT